MCLGWRFCAVLWKNDRRPLPWEQNPAASQLAHIWQLTRFLFFYDGLWIHYLPSRINECVAYLFCILLFCWIFAKVSRLRAFSLNPYGKVLMEGRHRPLLRGCGSDSADLYRTSFWFFTVRPSNSVPCVFYRNYHVFYYLLAGASEEERKSFHLLKPEEYHYLNQVGTLTLPHRAVG